MITRPPAIAGTFYPADADELARQINGLLAQARVAPSPPGKDSPPKAIIVPHAGLMFSGAIAADGFATVAGLCDRVKRIVIIGPAHRMAFQGMAVATADTFATPLGPLAVDMDAIQTALTLPSVQILDAAHRDEHGLEIELPFIQRLLGDVKIVPVLVSRCAPRHVFDLIEKLWGGSETLIVISSDLSHFYDDATARHKDARTRDLIMAFDTKNLGPDDACGALPIAGLLLSARKRAMTVTTLSMGNSGNASGDTSRVVGYGAWAFYEDDFITRTEDILHRHGAEILTLACSSIRHGLTHGHAFKPDLATLPEALQKDGASFVTLKKSGDLRGCIGSLAAHRPLAEDICLNAFKAAFHDPRFPAIAADELDVCLDISVSVLSPAADFPFDNQADLITRMTPFEDGLILTEGSRRGLFLPQVWEQLPNPADFLAQLKRKAGLPVDYGSDTLRIQRFVTRGINSTDLFPNGKIWR
ncbi:AmmeMemoRadiSam system protein B [Thalassospira sp.]|uniref:AmmeMemoRadiSam system protein B n=1 Tax=Thalassospira sp. TaxID=1912094 RepID=UPI002732EDD1|nr:AmmeMemoRadiSam system protein B [Thalassospira sp.]MDP2698471.1 AmmeMemoRadiSam system protein B [Thalassospira sp.]